MGRRTSNNKGQGAFKLLVFASHNFVKCRVKVANLVILLLVDDREAVLALFLKVVSERHRRCGTILIVDLSEACRYPLV